jgi:predicted nucleotide-binding protein
LVVLALSAITDQKESELLIKHISYLIPKTPCRTRKCFLGYSGAATGLALEVKDYLSKMIPALHIIDWKWDFQVGQALFAQIERASKECDFAVFLVTKDDDLMVHNGALASSPRDNIVFEVGFFAARMGMENTLLIVEQGAKLPSDWGGILYIPLRDRADISGVKMTLYTALMDRFGK